MRWGASISITLSPGIQLPFPRTGNLQFWNTSLPQSTHPLSPHVLRILGISMSLFLTKYFLVTSK